MPQSRGPVHNVEADEVALYARHRYTYIPIARLTSKAKKTYQFACFELPSQQGHSAP